MTLADTVKANGVPIDVGNNSDPDIVDWNEDGKKDIIIGQETSGYVRLYLNQGTNADPVFTTFSYLNCGGSPMIHYRANPRACDLDQDGKKDLIVGDQYAYLYYYKNEGTNANPVFNVKDTLELTTGAYIHEYAGVRPYCTDYNNDGAIDILTSDYYGYIRYYENTVFPGVAESKQAVVTDITISPNVTRDKTVLSYVLTQPAQVNIEVYAADGRLIDVLENRSRESGLHHLTWHRGQLASGIYFIKLDVEETNTTKKIIVL